MSVLNEYFPRPYNVSATDVMEAERLSLRKKGTAVEYNVYRAASAHGVHLRNVRVVGAPMPAATPHRRFRR